MQADQRTLELLSLCVCVTEAGLICDKKPLSWRSGRGPRSVGRLDHQLVCVHGLLDSTWLKLKCQPLIDTGVASC